MLYKFDSKEAKKQYREEVKKFADKRYKITSPIPEKPNYDYIKLAYKISDHYGPHNKKDPEYYGLSNLITEEEAHIAVKMRKRKKFTTADMVKKFPEYSEEKMDELLMDMSKRGFLEYVYNDAGVRTYWVPPFVVGMGEWSAIHYALEDDFSRGIEKPELTRFFERDTLLPIGEVGPMMAPGGTGSLGAMAIPVAKSLGLIVVTNGSAANRDRVLALGADRFLDYKTEDSKTLEANCIRTSVDGIYSLDEVNHAMGKVASGGSKGKTILKID